MSRTNECLNPSLKNNSTGWSSNGTGPTRTDVTSESMPRQFAARYDDGSVMFSASGAATQGTSWTVSVHIYPHSFQVNGTIFIIWQDSPGGSTLDFTGTAFTANALATTRISNTATAPTGTGGIQIVVTGENYASNICDYTAALFEQSGSLGTFFDGDTTNAVWNGTDGNSSSTLSDTASFPRDTADTLTASDSVASSTVAPRSVSDSASLSDAVARTVIAPRSVADSATLADAIARTVVLPRGIADSVTAGDTLSTSTVTPRSIADAASLADAVTRTAVSPRAASDALTMTDSVSFTVSSARATSDTMQLADLVARIAGHPRSVAGSVTLTDSLSRGPLTFTRTATDSLHMADAVHVEGETLPSLHDLGGSLITSGVLGGASIPRGLGGSHT